NTADQALTTAKGQAGPLSWLRAGTKEQPVLAKKGDDLRIDWGYLYIAAPSEGPVQQSVSTEAGALRAFCDNTAATQGADPSTGQPLFLHTKFPEKKIGEDP